MTTSPAWAGRRGETGEKASSSGGPQLSCSAYAGLPGRNGLQGRTPRRVRGTAGRKDARSSTHSRTEALCSRFASCRKPPADADVAEIVDDIAEDVPAAQGGGQGIGDGGEIQSACQGRVGARRRPKAPSACYHRADFVSAARRVPETPDFTAPEPVSAPCGERSGVRCQGVFGHAPRELPGVYRMPDAEAVCHVGKAKSLKKRVASYFRETTIRVLP